jgi:hypothetical protein
VFSVFRSTVFSLRRGSFQPAGVQVKEFESKFGKFLPRQALGEPALKPKLEAD